MPSAHHAIARKPIYVSPFPDPSTAYSWWIYPISSVINGTPLVSYVNNNGSQHIAACDVNGIPRKDIEIGNGVSKDDHSSAAMIQMESGNILYSWSNHGFDNLLYYRIVSASTPTVISGQPSSLTATAGTTYSQLFTNTNNVFWFHRNGNSAWTVRQSTNNASTWSAQRNFIGDSIADQLYMAGRNIGGSVMRAFVVTHATTASTNAIRIVDVNMTTGLASSGGVDLGYLDGTSASGNTLPAPRTNLLAIVSVGSSQKLRLLDVKSDGLGFAFCEFELDENPSDYKMARMTGLNPHIAGDWTISTIVGSGSPFYAPSYYVGGVVYANESHSGLRLYVSRNDAGTWLIERWDSAAGDGSDWVTTQLASSTDLRIRPISPVGAPSGFSVYWQTGTFYTIYTDYDLNLNLFD